MEFLSSKKILFVFEKYPSIYQNYIHLLINELRGKISLKILSYNDNNINSDFNIKINLIDKIFYKLFFIFKKENFRSDFNIFKKFDVIHIQHSFLFRKLNNYQKLKNQRIVITLRGGDTYIKPWISKEWRNFYLTNSVIDAYVVMSENQKKYLERWGVLENKIYVIPISFGNKKNIQPKYPNKEYLTLVSAFRMTWEKNIEGNLFFVKKLVEKGIKLKYDIYGDGEDLGQLYYLTDKYNLSKYVNILGKIDNESFKNKLKEYDFLLQLSFSDAMPITVIEAQSYGVPCIISNADGISEGIISDKTGFSEDFREIEKLINKTIELWNDSNRYYDFSKEAIEYVNNKFSIENEIQRIIRLYDNLYV